MSEPIPAAIRAELDQTAEWWDSQYQALVKKQIPRDPAAHEGHDLAEPITFWSTGYSIAPWCATCGVRLDRTPDG